RRRVLGADPRPEMASPRRPEPQPDAAAARAPTRGRTRPPPLTDQGLRGFRDVVVEAENLGEATAHAARSAREAYAAVPSDDPELDRVEPRLEVEGLRAPLPAPARAEPSARMPEEQRAPARQAETARAAETRPPRPMR